MASNAGSQFLNPVLVSYYNFYIVNLVFVLPKLDRKTKKFKKERHFVKRKHCKGIY